MKNSGFEWFKLDNAAKIFPGQNSRSWSNVFRISVELKENIDPCKLEKALINIMPRFPSFDVRIKPGFFWYYFEKNPKSPLVSPDVKNYCYRINFKENKNFLFRVYYYGKRISVDVYHAITDGYGCTVFLSTLTAEYLRLCGHEISSGGFVLDAKQFPKKEETEDAYYRYADSKVKYNRRDKTVYHAVGTKMPEHMCNYTVGIMSFEQVHKISKSYGVTVTEFFAAILMDIHYRKQLKEKKHQREVCVQIPVNLRKFFETETLRNFVLCLRVKMNPNMGEYSFEDLLKIVSYQLRLANDKREVNSMMTQNMKIERNAAARIIPLFIKNLSVSLTFLITGEQTTTALISNIGPVKLPEEMKEHIEKFMFFTGPGKLNGSRCGVISCGDKLVFTFSDCYVESDIEREFFTRLVKMGIHVKIESNR
ncbi:MAG: alcohol acetyltransferase [Acutalibacteraceae bacterium]